LQEGLDVCMQNILISYKRILTIFKANVRVVGAGSFVDSGSFPKIVLPYHT